MHNVLKLTRILPALVLLVSTTAEADTAYLRELQARAAERGLAETRAWRALIHYEDNWLRPGVTSTVATPWFFRAERGRTDPAAELNATLAAFFDPDDIQPREEPARCVYRARYRFLDRHLHFDSARMPKVECPEYDRWVAGLDPGSVSLVFPSAYPNGPSSMFGHTLLRIDAKGHERRAELLAYAINFAANTEEENGVIFAIKGLSGGYPGTYGVFPYYEKVKQYAWIENRDVWDYRLNLNDEEIRDLVAHLWEMRGVRFDYYFLTKNCSYQLLALLEAARPSLRLVDEFDWYAIPVDTIRILREVPGLLGPPEYRPALATELATQAGALPADRHDLAVAVAANGTSANQAVLEKLPERERARVLEVAHDYLYYRYQRGGASRDAALPRARSILLARSRIPVKADFPSPPVPGTPPDRGHDTLRLTTGGVWEDDVASLSLRLRPAYHDLLDPPGGYTPGAQVGFLDLAVRFKPDGGGLELESLALVDVLSISARDRLFKPVSWQVSTGLRQRPVAAPFDRDAHLGYYIEGGTGLAWGDLGGITGYVFALGSADANHGFDDGYALGAGASVGLLARPAPNWRMRAEIGGLDYAAGDDGHRAWARLAQQWPLARRFGLRLELGWEETARNDYARGILSLQGYF